jgi:carbonic anhydrase/acetyltransferase-like protein (isoleucine patch superfamily)
MIRSYKGMTPRLGERVYVDESAQVIGDVELGDHASVWMGAVIRGDVHTIRIGAYSNIQDNCVVHVYKEMHPTVIADHVTVGHGAILHGCRIDSYCLIAMGAIVLNDAHVGEECIVAAATLVPERMVIPPRSLVMGVPAKFKRQVTEEERLGIRRYAANYFDYKESFLAELQKK